MTEIPTSLRLPADLVERLDALVPRLQADPQIGTIGRVSRSVAIRLALLEGLGVLEAKHGVAATRGVKRTRPAHTRTR